jgi:hypothetical protein
MTVNVESISALILNAPETCEPEQKTGEIAKLKALFAVAAERLGGVDYKLFTKRDLIPPQTSYRLSFELECDNPYFKTLMSAMMAHEKANVTSPDVCKAPNANVSFEYKEGKLEKQYDRRIYPIFEALTKPDEQLKWSMDSMGELINKVPYSPQSEQDDVANFEIAGKKFHLALEPSQNFRDGALVMGMNIYASPVLQEVIRQELLDSRAAFKERPTGLVANGPTALNALNRVLGDEKLFAERLEQVEQNQARRNSAKR